MDKPWDEPELVEAFGGMYAGTLRYPAGTLGNTWDWDRGWLDPNVDEDELIPWVRTYNLPASSNRYTLDNLAKMYKATGVPVVFR